jgi:Protein of unknown function (DUF1302)
MKKKLLAMSVVAAISTQAHAFQFDTSDDWEIRWDNTFKANAMFRTSAIDKDVITNRYSGGSRGPTAGWFVADDSDLSVDRSNLGVVSTRLDVFSEMDVIFKQDFGFRISASAWYDPQYGSSSDHPSDRRQTWGQPSVDVGDYTDEAEDWHYLGGEVLDAFVFGNFDIGETSLGLRAGRHTIYWGNSLLAVGAINSFGGSMSPLDFNKGLSVPGTEAKELFRPTAKISGVWQLSDNTTLNAYYNFEHGRHRLPEAGTYFSPITGLTEDSEFVKVPAPTSSDPADLTSPIRTGYQTHYKDRHDSGDWGFNLQYYVDSWNLETSFIYMNYVDKNLHGLAGGADALIAVGLVPPYENPPGWDNGATAIGKGFWMFKEDIEMYGISLAKEIAGISVGLDIAYRQDAGLTPGFNETLGQAYNVPRGLDGLAEALGFHVLKNADGTNMTEEDLFKRDSSSTLGAVGDTWSVVMNGVGLLQDNGFWEGGSWIAEATFAMLDDCTENCHVLDPRVREDLWTTHVAFVFRPTWYQVRPGWDLTVPVSWSHMFGNRKKGLFTFAGDGEGGSASIGAELLIDQAWTFRADYNWRYGPVNAGIGGLLKDRDNISLTLKRTF